MVQNIYSKIHLVLYTNIHHDVTDLLNHGIVKNTKTWISWKQNIIFLQNKKILNLCFRWYILRIYHFLAEVTFKVAIFNVLKLILKIEDKNIKFEDFNLLQFYSKTCFNHLNKQNPFVCYIFIICESFVEKYTWFPKLLWLLSF